jgi:hypothetical protein
MEEPPAQFETLDLNEVLCAFVSPSAVEPEATNALKRGKWGKAISASNSAYCSKVDAPYWDDMGKWGGCRRDPGAFALLQFRASGNPLDPFFLGRASQMVN